MQMFDTYCMTHRLISNIDFADTCEIVIPEIIDKSFLCHIKYRYS